MNNPFFTIPDSVAGESISPAVNPLKEEPDQQDELSRLRRQGAVFDRQQPFSFV
jgi:hypothetical protein